jgi:hypothetical protein
MRFRHDLLLIFSLSLASLLQLKIGCLGDLWFGTALGAKLKKPYGKEIATNFVNTNNNLGAQHIIDICCKVSKGKNIAKILNYVHPINKLRTQHSEPTGFRLSMENSIRDPTTSCYHTYRLQNNVVERISLLSFAMVTLCTRHCLFCG